MGLNKNAELSVLQIAVELPHPARCFTLDSPQNTAPKMSTNSDLGKCASVISSPKVVMENIIRGTSFHLPRCENTT